jgi:methylmalonyl-CoA/ethylmalonyl-CoA epimerase
VKALKVDHIGIAVTSLAEGSKVYEAMGLSPGGIEEVAEQKVRVGFFPIGDTEVELLESTDPSISHSG